MELTGKRVAVTGATGFLGRYIVDVILKRGAHVIGVVRNPDRVPDLARQGVEMRKADLAERDRLVEGFMGADAVVSNAALFSIRNRNWQDHHRANIIGTTNVFEAIASARVKRVVHVSSVAVYRGHAKPKVTENHPQLSEQTRRGLTNAYAISKALSEQLAWRLAKQHALELTTVRPCAIYGAFDPNFMAVFKRLAGFPITIYPAFTRIPLVYAGDVAEAIALALENPVAVGKAYNITGDDRTVWEFATAWKRAGGRAALAMLPLPLPITWRYDNSRAETELGWHNRAFIDALRETIALERARDL